MTPQHYVFEKQELATQTWGRPRANKLSGVYPDLPNEPGLMRLNIVMAS